MDHDVAAPVSVLTVLVTVLPLCGPTATVDDVRVEDDHAARRRGEAGAAVATREQRSSRRACFGAGRAASLSHWIARRSGAAFARLILGTVYATGISHQCPARTAVERVIYCDRLTSLSSVCAISSQSMCASLFSWPYADVG